MTNLVFNIKGKEFVYGLSPHLDKPRFFNISGTEFVSQFCFVIDFDFLYANHELKTSVFELETSAFELETSVFELETSAFVNVDKTFHEK